MFKIITPLLLTILFYGSLLIVIAVKLFKYCFMNNTSGFSSLLKDIVALFVKKLEYFNKINIKTFSFWYKFAINLVIVFCVIFFALHFVAYAATYNEYGFSDIIRHEILIGQTFSNEIYKEGFYPLGMHSIIGLIISIFNIQPEIAMLYFGNFFVIVFFVALYFWMKNTFKTKTVLGIVFLLLVIVISVMLLSHSTTRMIYDGLHRFNWTLPEEMVLFEIFVSAVCLIRILKSNESMKSKDNISWLILFGISIATTLSVHYYTTLYQLVVCLSIFVVFVFKMNKEKFIALAISVTSGVFGGIITMIIGIIYSGGFSWSITWAQKLPTGDTQAFEEIASTIKSSENEQLANNVDNIFSAIGGGFKTFFEDGFMPLFPDALYIVFIVLIVFSIAALIILFIRNREESLNYLPILIMGIIFLLMYAAPLLNITRLLESYRLVICLYSVLMPFSVVWIDVLIDYFASKFLVGYEQQSI